MDRSPPSFSRRTDEPGFEFDLQGWALRGKKIGRENAKSRRFSASNLRSFREDSKSFRSIIAISSTASSPGIPPFGDEIDPSTYSFTAALKALQARSQECSSPARLVLNSKWNEAEKYICNPLSGEVPIECLSAKSLRGKSFLKSNARVVASQNSPKIETRPHRSATTSFRVEDNDDDDDEGAPSIQVKTKSMTRDVGTQSTPPNVSSISSSDSSPSPALTPSIQERLQKRCETPSGDSPHSIAMLLNSDMQVESTEEVERETQRKMEKAAESAAKEKCKCKGRQFRGGCLSLWMSRRQRAKHKC